LFVKFFLLVNQFSAKKPNSKQQVIEMNSQILNQSGASLLKVSFLRGEEENSRRSCSPSGGRSNFLDFLVLFDQAKRTMRTKEWMFSDRSCKARMLSKNTPKQLNFNYKNLFQS
jgi:hypothetical protein